MRVLVLHSRYRTPGGEETYVERIVPALRAAGHEAEALTIATPAQAGPADKARLFANMLWSLPARRDAARMVRRLRPHVLHAHNLYPNLSPSVLGAGGGAAVVLHLHNPRLVCPAASLRSRGAYCTRCVDGGPLAMWRAVRDDCRGDRVESAAYAAAIALHRAAGAYDGVDAFVTPTEFLRMILARGGLPAGRLHALPNFAAGAARGASRLDRAGEPYVLYAGRVTREKGVDVLLEAMRGARRFRLRVAGEGPFLDEARAMVARLGLPVDLLGLLDREAVGRLVAGARCAVVPSRFELGMPFAALEALAAGTPVVGSAVPGIEEAIGDAGVLVPPGDAPALAAALDDLVDNEVRRAGLLERARVRGERFRIDEHVRRLVGIYDGARARAGAREWRAAARDGAGT